MVQLRKNVKLNIQGHRGSRGTHPENTLVSFEEAYRAGADFIELDVHLSKDNLPVVHHDPEISSDCRYKTGKPVTKPLALRERFLSEIVEVDCGSRPNLRFPEQKAIKGATIPSLDEVLRWVSTKTRNFGVNIEMKMVAANPFDLPDPALFSEKVLEVVHKYGLIDRVIIQSFDFRPLVAAKDIEPKAILSCLFSEGTHFADRALEVGAKIVAPLFSLVTKEAVTACHASAIEVLPWTVNLESDWQRMVDLDVDGIITDYPRKLTSFLGRAQRG